MNNPNRVELTATIAAAQSLSDAIALDRNWLVALALPAAWTTAVLTFQGSNDTGSPTTWLDLYNETGEIVLSSAAASRGLVLPPALLHGWRWIRLRSGTAAAPVTQAADRLITCGIRQFA
jgi:hypothetical protein